jgi:hypothetical protein
MNQRNGSFRRYFTLPYLVLILLILCVLAGSLFLLFSAINGGHEANSGQGSPVSSASSIAVGNTATLTALTSTATMPVQPSATASVQANATATVISGNSPTVVVTQPVIAPTTPPAPSPTSTPAPPRDPYPPYTGTFRFNDPMSNNFQGHKWDDYVLPINNYCRFNGGAYEATYDISPGYLSGANACFATNTNFTDFVYQVQVTLMKGGCGGIGFRGSEATGSWYDFYICGLQIYEVTEYVNHFGSSHFVHATSSAIHSAYGQTNVLAVVAIGANMTLYANGQMLTSINDTSLTHGQIGCVAWGTRASMTTVYCRDAQVWSLP